MNNVLVLLIASFLSTTGQSQIEVAVIITETFCCIKTAAR